MTTTEILTSNIRETIRKARRGGAVGMSFANLKQITPTDCLTCHPAEYHRLFPQVAEVVAHGMKFHLYHAQGS